MKLSILVWVFILGTKCNIIFSPAKSNLVIIFKYFSSNFKFDLCYDFSIWNAESGRCIPKKMNDYENGEFYSFPPLCNRTEFNCKEAQSPFDYYCPNKGEICEVDDQGTHFFCKDSKTCIPKGEFTVCI